MTRQLGGYELLVELARGGMAELYLARARGAGGFAKLFAIKRILPHLADDAQFRAMFVHEGRIAAGLSHPNVCAVFELGEDGGELFLAMDYLDGVTWDVLARDPPAPPLAIVAGALAQACDGLHHAHARGVVHRDVSPHNLFVTTAGACTLLDFGVAKLRDSGPRTRTGTRKGKLAYMAPEQLRGEPVDARADVFALGVVLWEAVTGRRLFEREAEIETWDAIEQADIPSVASPAGPVIARALARDRDARFASAAEMAAALRALGAATDAQLADAVATRCAPVLAARARQVAAALANEAIEPAPGASVSVGLRAQSVAIAAPRRRRGLALLALLPLVLLPLALLARSNSPAPAPAGPDAALARPPADAAIPIDASLHIDAAQPRPTPTPAPAPRAPGTYSIDSTPYATIYIDNTRIGDTPLFRIPLAAGKHHVRAIRQDGTSRSFDITIAPGRPTSSGQLTW